MLVYFRISIPSAVLLFFFVLITLHCSVLSCIIEDTYSVSHLQRRRLLAPPLQRWHQHHHHVSHQQNHHLQPPIPCQFLILGTASDLVTSVFVSLLTQKTSQPLSSASKSQALTTAAPKQTVGSKRKASALPRS